MAKAGKPKQIRKPRNGVNPQAFADAMADGATLHAAILASGKTPAQARKGYRAVSGPMRVAYKERLGKDFDEMVELGKSVTPENLRHAVLGNIAKGIAERSDKGAQMCKLAGQWKELAMWKDETITGVFIDMPQLPAMPTINAQVIEAATPKLLQTHNNVEEKS